MGTGSGEASIMPSPWFSVRRVTKAVTLASGIGPSGGGLDSGARSVGMKTTPAVLT